MFRWGWKFTTMPGSFQVWIEDVEREIRREREENQIGSETKKRRKEADWRRRSDQRQKEQMKPRLSKRETLLEMLVGAVVGGGGSRRPRKIEDGGAGVNLEQEPRGGPHSTNLGG